VGLVLASIIVAAPRCAGWRRATIHFGALEDEEKSMGVATKRRGVVLSTAIAAATAAVLAMTGSTAHAANIVSDTWQDGTRNDPAAPVYSELGTDTDADGLESAWYNGGTGATAVASTGSLLLTPPNTSSAAWTTYFTPEATPITLANTGDNIKVTWVFTPTAAAQQANTSQNFRVALLDTPAAARLAADGSPGSDAYTGYGMFMNMSIGATANLGNSSPFRLMRRNVASGDTLGTSGNWTALGTTGAASGAHGYDSGTQYTFTMDVTRNASAGLDFIVKMVGGTLNNTGTAQVTFTDATPGAFGGFTFDSFLIRPSGQTTTADSFNTTLFQVETNVAVPEPTGAALLLAGAGLTGLARRRRRQ
jgi:hypothetical protein